MQLQRERSGERRAHRGAACREGGKSPSGATGATGGEGSCGKKLCQMLIAVWEPAQKPGEVLFQETRGECFCL